MIRYLIGFFVTIGLIILLIVLLFSGGGTKAPSKKVPTGKALSSYANTDAQVRVTLDGPINAVENHRQVQITVGRDNAVANVLQGYDGTVIETKTVANTESSYSAFLHSLELLGFTHGVTNNPSLKSEVGHCATGTRYVFEVLQQGEQIERFWATSCGGPHSYLGNISTTLSLFKQQVPEYNKLQTINNF